MVKTRLQKWEKYLLILGALLIVGGIVSGSLFGWNRRGADMETYMIWDAEGTDSIVIRAGSGNVYVYDQWNSEDAESLELNGYGTAWAAERENGQLTVTERERTFVQRFLQRGRDVYSVLWLPAEFEGSVTVVSDSGTIDLNGPTIKGNVLLRSRSGDVDFFDGEIDGDLTAETDSGYVYLSGTCIWNRLSARSDSGGISLNDSIISEGDVITDSGYLSFYSLECARFEAESDSGSIWLDDVTAADAITLSSNSGSINGTLKGSMENYTILSHSEYGSNVLPGTWGSGATKLTVTTKSGEIGLRFQERPWEK